MKYVPIRDARAIGLRVFADIVMLEVALLSALFLRLGWIVAFEPRVSPRTVVHTYTDDFVRVSPILVVIAIMVFAFVGFYTRGRMYRSRYKALVVAQAVTVAYLIVSSAIYVFQIAPSLPRVALIMAWGLTVTLLVGARLWSDIWGRLMASDSERAAPGGAGAGGPPTILVIGGDGYIGSALTPLLLEAGYRVRILSLFLYGTEPIQELLDHPRLEVINADFRQVNRVVEAVRGADMVVHLGAIVGDPACALNPEITIDVNLMATRMIAEVAKGYGVDRFVFASTCSVYGASDEVLDENSALNPVSLYARSKIACERVLSSMTDASFAPVILRFGTIYGLSGRTRFDLVVNLLTAKAVVERDITVSGADQWRPFVHVQDAARAVFEIVQAPRELVRNQTYNVGSDAQNFTIGQIGDLIQAAVPEATVRNVPFDSDPRNYRVSFSKIRHELGFEPRWNIEAGVRQVIGAIESGRIPDYRMAKYNNAKFLQEEGIDFLVSGTRREHRLLLDDLELFPAEPQVSQLRVAQ